MDKSILTLNDLLCKRKKFIIPYYQRGYIWGKPRGTDKDSVKYILESINAAYSNKKAKLFLQGITVTENDEAITLIDGQQRMTFFFLLLNYLESEKDFSIEYSIRKESQAFLEKIKNSKHEKILNLCNEDKNEPFQDIFYFKKTVRTIKKDITIPNKELIEFLLNNVKFLYVQIQEENATKVFSMMNGAKAPMKDGELVKAEILRLVSPQENKASQASAWEQNTLRSRYAREWDKWLYWWNKKEVQDFFHTKDVMGHLLTAYFKSKTHRSKKAEYSFQNFHEDCLLGSDSAQKAKTVFYELRALQKKFEDIYNSTADDKNFHNKIGAILCVSSKNDREAFIIDYFGNNSLSDTEIELYYKYVFLSLSHKEIIEAIKRSAESENTKSTRNKDEYEDKLEIQIEETIRALKNDHLYENSDNCKFAFLQLLRLNIEADSRLERTFDFSVWKQKSLEHIFPKSKVYHTDEKRKLFDGNNNPLKKNDITSDMLNRADFGGNGSEHCIGNLVLLYKSDNSSFSAKSFAHKKESYFDMESLRNFKSRTLLHTMSVFAREKWDVESIQQNKNNIIDGVKEYYGK